MMFKHTQKWVFELSYLKPMAIITEPFGEYFPKGSNIYLFSLLYLLFFVLVYFNNSDSYKKNRRRQWHPTPVFLPGKSHGRKSLVGCSPWGLCRTRLSDFTFTFHFHGLEEEMVTHSSVLPWRIPGVGEPGGLPSMGSHRLGHELKQQ